MPGHPVVAFLPPFMPGHPVVAFLPPFMPGHPVVAFLPPFIYFGSIKSSYKVLYFEI